MLKLLHLHNPTVQQQQDLTLNDWLKYGKTLNIDSRTNIDIEHIYEDGDSDFEEEGSAGQSSTVSILTSELYPNPANHITWIREPVILLIMNMHH